MDSANEPDAVARKTGKALADGPRKLLLDFVSSVADTLGGINFI